VDRDAIRRRVAEFQRAYINDPDFVDQQYELPSVAELLARNGVVGVARYIEFPSFESERLFTLVYHPYTIEVSAVVGETSLWGTMPAICQDVSTGEYEVEDGEPFDPARAWRRSAIVTEPARQCPILLRSWESITTAAVQAGNCLTDVCDGIVYRHRAASHGFQAIADWYNPKLPDHAMQVTLIEQYVTLLQGLSLYPE
jgi:hypothetical protein